MRELDILNKKIEDAEKYLEVLKERRDVILAEAAEENAYKNSYEMMYDGLKYTADRDNPINLKLPMKVHRNLIYSYNGKNYVCIADGIAAAENFDEFFTEDYTAEDNSDD